MPDQYGPAVTASAPIAWYRFNGATTDETGGTAGTLTNGATYDTGIVPFGAAQALALDGTNDFVSIPDQNKLDLTTNFTITAWVRPNSLPLAGSIVSKVAWTFQISGSVISWFQSGGASNATTPNLSTTAPNYVAITVSGGTVRFYLNGAAVGTDSGYGSLTANTNPLRIGSYDGASEYINGRVADVAIYNRVLPQTELQSLYDSATVGVTPKTGTASGTWTSTGAASGKRQPRSTAAGSWATTGAATGTAARRGTASGTVAFAGSAVGVRSPKATASGATSWAGVASGKRTPKATASGLTLFAGAAVGVAPSLNFRTGTATGHVAWTGVATGRTSRRGAASGHITWVGDAHTFTPTTGRDITVAVGHVTTRSLAATLAARGLEGLAQPGGTVSATLATRTTSGALTTRRLTGTLED